jgi:hypothetical protein
MTITCKNISKSVVVSAFAAAVLLPAIVRADLQSGIDTSAPLAFSEPSAAASVSQYATKASFDSGGSVLGASARISIVEKTNVPTPVPVPASLGLLLIGGVVAAVARKKK